MIFILLKQYFGKQTRVSYKLVNWCLRHGGYIYTFLSGRRKLCVVLEYSVIGTDNFLDVKHPLLILTTFIISLPILQYKDRSTLVDYIVLVSNG